MAGAKCTLRNPGPRHHWSKTLGRATLLLPRTKECFQQIEADAMLDYDLPRRPDMTAGQILKHCYTTLDKILDQQKPCIFKIGYTHCAFYRFYNDMFGYVREMDRWQKMVVLYASHETTGPSFVEGALIQRHKGHLP